MSTGSDFGKLGAGGSVQAAAGVAATPVAAAAASGVDPLATTRDGVSARTGGGVVDAIAAAATAPAGTAAVMATDGVVSPSCGAAFPDFLGHLARYERDV